MSPSRIAGLVIAAILVIVIALALVTTSRKSDTFPTPSLTPISSQSPSASPSSTAAPGAVLIFNGSTFSPSQVTLSAGQTLEIKNTSTVSVQVDSDPHPAHTDDPELNIGTITPGQTMTVTLTKTGTFGLHNHLNPTEKATVTIQ